MINHISQNENTKDDFSKAIKELQIGKLLRNSNVSLMKLPIIGANFYCFLPLR